MGLPLRSKERKMETKEYASQDQENMINDKYLKARSGAETKRKPEPKNKMRQPENKTREETA